jgi:hypothetical protein
VTSLAPRARQTGVSAGAHAAIAAAARPRASLRDDSRVVPPQLASLTNERVARSVTRTAYSPADYTLLRGPVELGQYTEHESFPSPCANQTYQVTFAAVDGPQDFLPVFLGPTVAQVDFYLDDHDNVISATILGFSQALLIGWDQFDPVIGDTCEMTENGPLPALDLTKPLNASALNSGQPVTVSFDQITNKNSLAYDVTWHSTISFRWVKDPPPQQPPG